KSLNRVRTGTPVRAVERLGDRSGVDVTTAEGVAERYSAAVIATHPDTALRILAHPTQAEQRALSAFRYSRNETVLHQDPAVLPKARRARAAWNYLLPDCGARSDRVLVSYDMNVLQHIPGSRPYVVTLNATSQIAPQQVIARMVYEHPIFTPESVAAQKLLPALNDGLLAFAGAYHGWGFHEDGCRAGVAAAESLGSGW
ncbi:MAG TPA: FAD-dependent oxidoreductase, partial [Acidimicrobiales bacterium]|nr:FAD-dependent oxidoreductase [Acidimicrobiales bacterium]